MTTGPPGHSGGIHTGRAKAPGHIKRQEGEGVRDQQVPQHHDRRQAYSLPFMPPAVNVNHDEAIRLCEAKAPAGTLSLTTSGRRWPPELGERHRADRKHQQRQKPQPPGADGHYIQRQLRKNAGRLRPIEWNHDRTAEGVADMVGNVWEHVGGVRFLNGQVQIIPDNEAAAGADQSPDSKEWTAIYTPDGDPVYYNVKDGEIVLQPTAPEGKGLRRRSLLRPPRAHRHGSAGQADRARPLSRARL